MTQLAQKEMITIQSIAFAFDNINKFVLII
jgi:hypothetical protein